MNFGPQHPAAHGVLRLVFEMDGEKPFQNLGQYDLVVTSMTLHWFEYPLVGIQRLAELGP